jgi:hypothetical protein
MEELVEGSRRFREDAFPKSPHAQSSPHTERHTSAPLWFCATDRTSRVPDSKGDQHMFLLTASGIAQTLGHGPSARLGRPATALAIIVGTAAIALLSFAHTTSAAENSTRMAREHHACAVVLRLDPSGRRYDTCIRSLERSLSEWDRAALVSTNRSTCAWKGLQPGTPAFAVCVVNADQYP